MKKIWTSFVLCLIMSLSVLGLVACGKEEIPVESISFESSSVEMFIGSSKQLRYEVLPANATGFSLEWTSSNPKIASVDYRGRVSASSTYGEVVITVKEKNSGVTASCNIIINDGEVYKITPNTASMKTQYYKGETFDPTGLVVYAYYESGKSRELLPSEYTLSYPEVLTEDVKVYVTYGENKSYIELTVIEDFITGITVTNPPIKTNYFVGERFDPTGMTVAFVYASGKIKQIEGFTCDDQPLMYGNDEVKISYGEYETYFKVTIQANIIINNITKLQSAIDNAEVGSSIMISNGTFNISTPIKVPKSKNLTIFGESKETVIYSSGDSVFSIVNDIDDDKSYYTIIANMTMNSTNSTRSIILVDNQSSINNLNNLNLVISKVDIVIPANGNAINLSAKTEGFEKTTLENVNLTMEECNIYDNGTSEVYDNSTIILNGLENGTINIKNSNFMSKGQLLSIENSSNLKLNIENSLIESNLCAINLNNISGGDISITKQSYIKGNPAINMANCTDLDITADNSYLTTYSIKSDSSENENQANVEIENSSIIIMTGCQNVNFNLTKTTLTLANFDDNKNCFIVIIQDGENTLSSNNNLTFTDCSFNGANENKYLNLEKEQTSVINENVTEQ